MNRMAAMSDTPLSARGRRYCSTGCGKIRIGCIWGGLGFILNRSDGAEAKPSDVTLAGQTLDLWNGIIESNFQFEGQTVRVQTACHPELDALAVRIVSPLVGMGKLGVRLAFPYASPEIDMADWDSPLKHETRCETSDGAAEFRRTLDGDRYFARLKWTNGNFKQLGPHEFSIMASGGNELDVVIHFSPETHANALPSAEQILQASADRWEQFWTGGAAIDLSGSSDSRANELERRIVLSQYNTALHCAGPMPPPETGLLFNSWYGKSHLEMHWWHGVHFAAWNRFELFEREPRFLSADFAGGETDGAAAGIRWRSLAEDGGAGGARFAFTHWAAADLAAAASDLLRGALLSPDADERDDWTKWSEIVFETANFHGEFCGAGRGSICAWAADEIRAGECGCHGDEESDV